MGVNIQGIQTNWGPKGVQDSLILYWDAANKESYPGSGTTINDLTINEISGSFMTTYGTNTPYYNSLNGLGHLVFTSSNNPQSYQNDNRIFFDLKNSSLSTVTVDMWCRIRLTGWYQTFFSFTQVPSWDSTGGIQFYQVIWYPDLTIGGLGFNTSAIDFYGIQGSVMEPILNSGNWVNLVFIMNNFANGGYSNNKIYVNGVNYNLIVGGSGVQNTSWTNFTGYGILGTYLNSNNSNGFEAQPAEMDVSTFKIYDRALSQTEITQNYNALKSRFGIF